MKLCPDCNEIKSKSEYYRNHSPCKVCFCKRTKQYYTDNRERMNAWHREYRRRNPEMTIAIRKKHYYLNREKCIEISKNYTRNNNEKVREAERARLLKNPKHRISKSMAKAIRASMLGKIHGSMWETYVGYGVNDLKERLESMFVEGMSWDNYGFYGWHIDHIMPLASFNYSSVDDEDFKKCWSLENLQPSWAIDKIRKGCKIPLPKVAMNGR